MKTILTSAFLALMLLPAASAADVGGGKINLESDAIAEFVNTDQGGKCNGYYDTNCEYYGYEPQAGGWGWYDCGTWAAGDCIIG